MHLPFPGIALTPRAAGEGTITDRRSGRVVFVSHCLLNENVRYLGGACRPGPVGEYIERWRADGVGICQMPCPEQRVWGGVAKRFLAPAYGSRSSALWPLRHVLVALFVLYTRFRYAVMARRVAGEIADYRRSGYRVEGVVGVGGSPSCGIYTTLDPSAWLEAIGSVAPQDLSAATVNRAVISAARPGRGWFMRPLIGRLERGGSVPTLSDHDLVGELESASAGGGPATFSVA